MRPALGSHRRNNEGNTTTRKGQEDKRRREEAELRRMIQKEMQKANDTQLLLDEQDSQIAAVEKQAGAREEMAEAQKRQMLGDVAKWERRLAQRLEGFAIREKELGDIEEQVRALQLQQTQHKLTLSAKFLRHDMKPDFAVDPSEIFARSSLSHKAGSPLKRAASQLGPQHQLASPDGGSASKPLGRHRAASMKGAPPSSDGADASSPLKRERGASVVVKELDLEPQLDHLRGQMLAIQHETNLQRAKYTGDVKAELRKLHLELSSEASNSTAPVTSFF